MGVLRWIVNNLLLVLTVGGVFVGTAIGFVLRPYNLSEETIMLLSFPGDVLMRMLKMIILPLIISSLIAGTMNIDKPQVGLDDERKFPYISTTFRKTQQFFH